MKDKTLENGSINTIPPLVEFPTKFTLGAIEYTIKIVEDLDLNGMGRASTGSKQIILSKTHNNKPIPIGGIEQTLYHELIHCILDELGRADLSGDETFVQSFSLLLHQFEKTKK